LIALPDVPHLLVLHAGAVTNAALPDVLQTFDVLLRAQWARGRVVLFTEGAARVLATVVPSGPSVVQALHTSYRLERIDLGGDPAAGNGVFRGWRVTAK
jgi:hypothetical protein